jgi:hypothetical protein
MRHLIAAAVLASATLVGAPATVSGQDHHQIVLDQLHRAATLLTAEGFRGDMEAFRRDRVVGLLPDGGTALLEIELVAGTSYWIVGSCDFDCDDLDLRLFANDGSAMIVEDVEADDTPMLRCTAPASGRFVLAVDMPSCSESLCYYGFAIYRK